MNTSPFKALFGCEPKTGLISSLPPEILDIHNIGTEEDLDVFLEGQEQDMSVTDASSQESLVTCPTQTSVSDENLPDCSLALMTEPSSSTTDMETDSNDCVQCGRHVGSSHGRCISCGKAVHVVWGKFLGDEEEGYSFSSSSLSKVISRLRTSCNVPALLQYSDFAIRRANPTKTTN